MCETDPKGTSRQGERKAFDEQVAGDVTPSRAKCRRSLLLAVNRSSPWCR
jgi:hypothetical protein